MSSYVLLPYLVMAATLGRAVLVAAKLAPSQLVRESCRRCRLPFERSALGERICSCDARTSS